MQGEWAKHLIPGLRKWGIRAWWIDFRRGIYEICLEWAKYWTTEKIQKNGVAWLIWSCYKGGLY